VTQEISPQDIVSFWQEAGPERWFKSDPAFDEMLRARFFGLYESAVDGELDDWPASAEGALALVLVLDQFPRNMFRNTPRAFAADDLALAAADRAIASGHDRSVTEALRSFFYMPFMHSERLADQERCVALMQAHGGADNIKYADIHRDVIRRFGRFPHRNEILGRTSEPEEIAYLEGGGFKG
jgi:uncharacterized protein (DUF924 family)